MCPGSFFTSSMPSTQDILKEKTAGGLYILKEGMKGKNMVQEIWKKQNMEPSHRIKKLARFFKRLDPRGFLNHRIKKFL